MARRASGLYAKQLKNKLVYESGKYEDISHIARRVKIKYPTFVTPHLRTLVEAMFPVQPEDRFDEPLLHLVGFMRLAGTFGPSDSIFSFGMKNKEVSEDCISVEVSFCHDPEIGYLFVAAGDLKRPRSAE